MRRRTVLAGVASLAALGGCSRVFGSDAVRVRVMRADDERVQNAEAHCTLSESFVADNPILERLLEAARDAPTGEWVTTGADRETGEVLLAAVEQHCDQQDGVSDERSESEARRGAKSFETAKPFRDDERREASFEPRIDGVYHFDGEAFVVNVETNVS